MDSDISSSGEAENTLLMLHFTLELSGWDGQRHSPASIIERD
jgi:hypothetical protein